MNRRELYSVIRTLSDGFLKGKINGELYANAVESLIMTNTKMIPELEKFADFLAQYHPNQDIPELYGNRELKEKIKVLFKLK